jgi:stage V sporulation protein D (sporulation-specific penicillin-binding protein)
VAKRKKRRERRFTKKMQIKLMVLFAFILFILVGLNIRIAFITAKSGDKYAKQVLSQQRYDSRTIPYRRGEIQEANGNVLAKSEQVYNVVLDCYAVNGNKEYVEPTVRALVSVLGLDETDIRKRLTSEETKQSQYQVLKREVSITDKKKFEEYASPSDRKQFTKEALEERDNIQGVWFESYYIRKYPMGTMASNVVGFSNTANDGACGLEAYYTDVLNGVNGREYGYLNEDSELQRTVIEPEHGKTIVSTLDVNVQEIVEKYIREFDEEYFSDADSERRGKGSKNTGVIVGNPNTGEIYAMATNHGFDLNNPQDISEWYTEDELSAKLEEVKSKLMEETNGKCTEEEIEEAQEEARSEILNDIWSNFCVTESFEPGSTFKPITVSSALETGALTGDETFYCDGGEFVTDTQINCDNIYGHGMETISDAIMNSCNDALMQIGFKLQIEDFCKYQRLFNFGRVTGIDLPNESSGILYDRDAMHEVELATNSFGQGFTCTMIQEYAAFSAVVNGGYYYRPHLVKQILDADGGVAKSIEPLLLSQPISARSSSILRDALEAGVREGTGKKAKVPGYRMGGKTGTAEKINPATGQRWAGRYIVSFIGCVPIDDPQVVIYVVIDEPNVPDQSTGGYAQIIARKILQESLPYLNIYPTEEVTDEELQKIGITREEAEIGRQVDTAQPETDENGNVIETEPETDENGNVIETENGVADNPNMASPPEDNGKNLENTGPDAGITNEELGLE